MSSRSGRASYVQACLCLQRHQFGSQEKIKNPKQTGAAKNETETEHELDMIRLETGFALMEELKTSNELSCALWQHQSKRSQLPHGWLSSIFWLKVCSGAYA